ncbi:xylose isomerase [Roseateles paludis]|jgi:xylose isomerase|uniref:Xylose isomerase n=1 Tax=Roseateles paludis TaxID=3145238 RepID=A0ABV0FWT3_9BURK
MSIFANIAPIKYEGPNTSNPLAYRYYDENRVVLGKTMKEQLRFAVCYWHNFCWNGFDPFSHSGTLERPWFTIADPMEAAKAKADEAFAFISKLGVPYYAFHDRDVAPEGKTPKESVENLKAMVDVLGQKQADTGIKLLWGTANAFSHRRFMSGAGTNPDADIFSLAALQVREAMNATKTLGGINYVLWGGREGYETLLNTDLKREAQQFGRFLQMVVEHKHKIGLPGFIMIEPKPREPSKHQYDFDTATVYGMLKQWGLENEVKVNIEANHATLAGHSFEHEIAIANSLGIFGSIDMNRGDMQCGWDTDQFPNNIPETALALYYILQGGGFTHGGLNFDAKARRQSLDAEDMFHAHIGGMDVCARALLIAEAMIKDGTMAKFVEDRYATWQAPWAQEVLAGKSNLDAVANRALQANVDKAPASGRQEFLENWCNKFI